MMIQVRFQKFFTVWFDDDHLPACVDQILFTTSSVSNKETTPEAIVASGSCAVTIVEMTYSIPN